MTDIPAPLEYSEFPMWLNRGKGDSVLVYSLDQENEFRAKGYTAPGIADPHAYLVSKATEKMDDAIRTMNADVERKVRAGLADVYNKLYKTLIDELNMRTKHKDWYASIEDEGITTPNMQSTLDNLTTDIMSIVRQTSRGTN